MAITQTIAILPAVLNDSATFYEDIAERNNSLVTTVLPSINAWATQANLTQTEINDKAAQVAAQAIDGGYSQDYINTNFVGVNNAQNITAVKTFTSSPIVPTPTANTQAANKQYADLKVALAAFTGANVNLASSGYQKLPSGLIIQWGNNLSRTLFSLPISFPNKKAAITGNHVGAVTVAIASDEEYFDSKSQHKFLDSYASEVTVHWIAIGY